MLHKSILKTAKLSFIIQLIVLFIILIGLILPIKQYIILKEILYLELLVQIIEIIFYSWLIYNWYSLHHNITHRRYLDWIISTPFMLLIIILFMEYNIEPNVTTKEILTRDFHLLLSIFISNSLMLLSGFLGEIKKMNQYVSLLLGTLFFIITFSMIYINYINNNTFNFIIILFNILIWSLYGFVYLFPFTLKNNLYNILDIFSKNFTAIFIFVYTFFI